MGNGRRSSNRQVRAFSYSFHLWKDQEKGKGELEESYVLFLRECGTFQKDCKVNLTQKKPR